MSILSQIGIVVLIVFIAGVLFFANKRLEREANKEEQFPPGWKEYKKSVAEEKEQRLDTQEVLEPVGKESVVAEVHVPEESYVEPKEKKILDERESNCVTYFLTLVHLDEHHIPMEEIEVKSLPFTIGRSRENSLVLDDLYVARQHCKIVKKEEQLILQDLGTANKIIAKGRSVEECLLEDGMRFYLGNEEFLVKKQR